MKKKTRVKLIGIVLILGVVFSGFIFRNNMLLLKAIGFQVEYKVGAQPFPDGQVFRHGKDRTNFYLYLPHFTSHPWWRFQPDSGLLQSIPPPRKWAGMRLMTDTPIGVSIDFEPKIGFWDHSYSNTQMEFGNESLSCKIIYPTP